MRVAAAAVATVAGQLAALLYLYGQNNVCTRVVAADSPPVHGRVPILRTDMLGWPRARHCHTPYEVGHDLEEWVVHSRLTVSHECIPHQRVMLAARRNNSGHLRGSAVRQPAAAQLPVGRAPARLL